MDVFIGNLPETITPEVVEKLLAPFERQVPIKLHRHTGKDGKAGCYGVCSFSSERIARKAIKKLDGYTLFSRQLAVREFLYRSYSNERRALGWRERLWHGVERRSNERRGGRVLAKADDLFAEAKPATPAAAEEPGRIVISGYRDFATKHT